ncbi:methyl-accepting chemotaxis protein [Novosphingobium bradum]|uniref:Methyl-accepting chemotaxis protein n=1 Tax=Novosphingobium bradum TaxID=1737444 RepID=A0ABV7IPY1_9SPHN
MPDISVPELIDYFDVHPAEADARARVADLIRNHGHAALGALYDRIAATPRTAAFFPSTDAMDQAKGLQFRHWLRLFEDGPSAEYHAAAERIGTTHARIGLDPHWYVGGYATVMDRLLSRLLRNPLRRLSGSRLSATVRSFVRHALLDMTIALGGYFRAEAEKKDAVVRKLCQAMKELSAGNFAVEIEDLPADYAELKRDFDAMRDTVGQLLGNLAETSHSVRICSSEIRAASDDLSVRSEHQAASIDEITRDAVAGGEVAGQAAAAMAAISEASAKVSAFSDAIDSISFQTSLLALNAGVEAARAGDAGRGFAVVASEVRALSQRAAETAQQIKSLSTLNAERISQGANRVHTMGDLLNSIAGRIEESNRMIQANAALSEQTNAATRSLVEQADVLDRMVSQFQTAGSARGDADRPAARPEAAASRPPATTIAGTHSSGTSTPGTGASPRSGPGPRQALPRPLAHAAVNMNDWSEF